MPATTADTLSLVTRTVSVAPLVLLSVADHYGRTAKGTRRRVVGVLLGQNDGKNVRVSNSFAVPFEEDDKDPSVWFLDHNFVESMNDMFKKINAREKLIGWYHSGPKLRASDLEINELFKRYTPNPLLVIIDDGHTSKTSFIPHHRTVVDSGRIGVEHLLRDIRDVAVGTLSTRITSQLQSLQGLHLRLRDIGQYLQKVLDRELPVNHAILGNLQDIFNLLPNLAAAKQRSSGNASEQPQIENTELARAMNMKTNDQLMSIYISSLIRAITAFHDLIENKIQNRQQQEEQEAKLEEGKDEKAVTNGNTEEKKKNNSEPKDESDSSKNKKKG
ncbi:26S proteasome regulatory subunit rpn-8 [Coccidioides immitis RMSCC 3703]|uniref:26S proteasome regulatory subunit rpn-8 n=1 Tax=Coccidioides immitis RMSCC 3703 TaxID=454286 RepID=A0A0J8R8N0_COCIT|nr:26S proteasome regulatory subunit rpn-8 [Coccidioides immitis RMSCC 3703]